MSRNLCVEGIILKTVKFKDHDLILTIFTETDGLLKLFGKGFANPKRTKGQIASPLVKAEFICTETRSELYRCSEISLLNPQLKLRKTLASIEAGQKMLHAIYSTQYPNKPAPLLYKLLERYLEEIPSFTNPEVLTASFFLKILRHEGVVNIEHPPFNDPHWKTLTLSQSIHELKELQMTTYSLEAIATHFSAAVSEARGS